MITRRAALAASVAAFAVQPAVAAAAPTPPTLGELLQEPAIRGAAMSPDGKRIAVVGETWSGGKRSAYIDIIRADDPNLARTKVSVGENDVEDVHWANNERLLLQTVRKLNDYERKATNWIGDVDSVRVRRLLSITAEGRNPAVMFANDVNLHKINFNLARVVSLLPQDPLHIMMRAQEADRFNLYLVNVETGASEIVERGGPMTNNWEIQNGRAVLRWDFFTGGGAGAILSRPEGETKWTQVRRFRRSEVLKPDFDILGDAGEPGMFLVSVREDTDATTTIRKWDVRSGQLGETVAGRPTLDVDGALFDKNGIFVASSFIEDRLAYDFADKTLAPHYRGIEGFFGRECNVRIIDLSADRNRLLMHVSGPRLPGAYYFYDLQAKHLENLGVSHPWLLEDRLAPVELLDVKLRDGGAMRAYLTEPLASGPRPMIVLPHGGPEMRDHHSYDVYAQIFAAQGWLVLQPNFRGSGGYGRAYADAGRRRWADRMQEDVEDAVAQVLASGRADPKRVAIWGASYGGYAALMGAVRNPDLYKAAVAVAGPADLAQFMDDRKSYGLDNPYYQYWVRTLGDPKADLAALQASSPARRAAEIKAPVLLVHGLEDSNVLPNQSRIMAAALRAAGKSVVHLEIRGADHSDWDEDAERKLATESVAFLAKALA